MRLASLYEVTAKTRGRPGKLRLRHVLTRKNTKHCSFSKYFRFWSIWWS